MGLWKMQLEFELVPLIKGLTRKKYNILLGHLTDLTKAL
jgi:hypothetical protein